MSPIARGREVFPQGSAKLDAVPGKSGAGVGERLARPGVADALRRAIGCIEGAEGAGRRRVSFGIPGIDGALPGGGLCLGCVHEVGGDQAATGFCAVLLARAGEGGGSLLWLTRGDDLYPPGLVRYGIEAGRLLIASGLRRQADVLWAMEEALRCRDLRAVVAETGPVGLAASRRLMLAAEGSEVLGLALSLGKNRGVGVPTAVSRWRITAVPGSAPPGADAALTGGSRSQEPGAGTERWRVQLLHCRGGRPVEGILGWDDKGWDIPPPTDPAAFPGGRLARGVWTGPDRAREGGTSQRRPSPSVFRRVG